MGIITNIIRGGQLLLHSLRMFRQVFYALLLWSFLLGAISFGIKFYLSVSKEEVVAWTYYHLGELLHEVKLGNIRLAIHGTKYQIPASNISSYPYFIEAKKKAESKLVLSLILGGRVIFATFFVTALICIIRGLGKSGEQFNRGAKFGDFIKVKKEILKQNKSQKYWGYSIADMPYPRYSEMEHTIVIGSTGSGKTVIISELVEQIRKRGDRAIIYDKKCDYIRWFYDDKKDVILNPFDVRGAKWNLLAEIEHIGHLKPISQSFITDSGMYSEAGKIWDEAARIAFSGILEKLICTGQDLTNRQIVDLILRQDIAEVAKLAQNTYAQSTIDPNSPKTAASVMFVLATHFSALRLTSGKKDESFSIKKWLKSEHRDSILFISSQQDLNNELSPLITAWFEIAISGILSYEQNMDRRTWVILDELPTIQKIPSLSQGLSVARSYGGCFVLGCQNIAQMREIYGKNLTEDISSECNTRVFFKTNDPDTAKWMCQNIGEAEIMQHKEGLSYGAHAMRDGVNLNAHDKVQYLVLPSEIQSMQKLELFVKVPGANIVKTTLKYQQRKDLNKSFISNTELISELQKTYTQEAKQEEVILSKVKPTIPDKRAKKLTEEHIFS